MRIAGHKGKPLNHVSIALSDAEAAELVTVLQNLPSAKEGWHEHLSDATFERDIGVYREDDETAPF
jgi:hypothetical protein